MQSVRSQDRKKDTREKIQLGGLVVKAGLRDMNKAVLLGWLCELQGRLISDPDEWARLQALGKESFENGSEEDDDAGDTDRPDAGDHNRHEGD